MTNPGALVCARATAPYAAKDSTFDRKCQRCAARVMIAPSGRQVLASKPGLEIICVQCFVATADPDPDVKIEMAGQPETVLQEIAGAVPNSYRSRN